MSLVKFKSKKLVAGLILSVPVSTSLTGQKQKKLHNFKHFFFVVDRHFTFLLLQGLFETKPVLFFFLFFESKSFSSVWQQLGGATLVALATKNNNTDELVRIRMALVRVVKCPKLCPRRSRVRTPGACFVF